jgi:hypothetical protein
LRGNREGIKGCRQRGHQDCGRPAQR